MVAKCKWRLRDACDVFYFVDFLQVVTDGAYVIGIVDFKLGFAMEYALGGFDGEATNVDVELGRKYSGNLMENPDAVDALDAYGSRKVQVAVSIPTGSENAVAGRDFEAVGLRALTLVDGYAACFVETAKYIVSWDGMATFSKDIAWNGLFVEDNRFLAVDGFLYGLPFCF